MEVRSLRKRVNRVSGTSIKPVACNNSFNILSELDISNRLNKVNENLIWMFWVILWLDI